MKLYLICRAEHRTDLVRGLGNGYIPPFLSGVGGVLSFKKRIDFSPSKCVKLKRR